MAGRRNVTQEEVGDGRQKLKDAFTPYMIWFGFLVDFAHSPNLVNITISSGLFSEIIWTIYQVDVAHFPT